MTSVSKVLVFLNFVYNPIMISKVNVSMYNVFLWKVLFELMEKENTQNYLKTEVLFAKRHFLGKLWQDNKTTSYRISVKTLRNFVVLTELTVVLTELNVMFNYHNNFLIRLIRCLVL